MSFPPPPPDFAGIEKRTKTERDNLLLLNKSKQRFLFLVFGFTAVYNQERLILQTIYLLNKGIKFAVYNQERVLMARVWYIEIKRNPLLLLS